MKQLVEVKRGEVFCDSQMVAEKFDHKHLYIVSAIEKLLARQSRIKGLTLLPLKFEEIEREYRGQKFKAYLMDRRAFTALAMDFKGDKAFRWRLEFIDAFFAMEQRLISEETNKKNTAWVTQREQGKIIRLTTTDAVKDFTEYAKAQGSQNAQFYYKHITQACYKCLQLIEAKRPKLRDTLDMLQLNQLMMAEVVAERSIRKHMSEGEHYKTIFTLVKQDLERFADGLMIPNQNRTALAGSGN
jgi:Rha family phage regulatory protein